jgi:hypothetical protein
VAGAVGGDAAGSRVVTAVGAGAFVAEPTASIVAPVATVAELPAPDADGAGSGTWDGIATGRSGVAPVAAVSVAGSVDPGSGSVPTTKRVPGAMYSGAYP